MGTVLYVLFGLWLLFVGWKLLWAVLCWASLIVHALRKQKGANE